MFNTPLSPLRRLLLAGISLLAGGLVSLSADQPRAQEKVNFEGKWDGKYEPSQGKPGEGKYEFHKEKDGQWEVTVTWVEGKETRMMKLKGERLGPDALRLTGKAGETTYYYIGRMEGGAVVFHYLSIDGKTGKSGSGVSRLKRPKE